MALGAWLLTAFVKKGKSSECTFSEWPFINLVFLNEHQMVDVTEDEWGSFWTERVRLIKRGLA